MFTDCCTVENPNGKKENSTLFSRLNRVEFEGKHHLVILVRFLKKIVNNTQLYNIGGE